MFKVSVSTAGFRVLRIFKAAKLGMFAVRYSPFAKMRPGPISLVCDGKCVRSNTIIAVGPKDLEWSSLKQGEDVQRKQKDDGLSLSLQLE